MKVAPWPGSDCARSLPPLASTKPRAIASPSPVPAARRRRRGRARRSRSRSARETPGPWSVIRIATSAPDPLGGDRHRLVAGVADRVLDHVRERPLELGRVGLEQRQVGLDRDVERRRGRRSTLRDRGLDQLLGRGPVGARVQLAGLQAREVEQVVDQAREPARTRSRSPRPALRAPRRRASASSSPPAAAVIAVSGERRSCETERRSAVLTTFERRSACVSITCASRPSRRRAAVEQRLEARDHPPLELLDHLRVGAARDRHRAGALAVDDDRQRPAALVAVAPAGLDLDPGQVERLRDPLSDDAQRVVEALAAEQHPRHLGGQVGLARGGARPPRRGCARARRASR